MKIILASSSPRRRELLGTIVKDFEIIPSSFDEEKIKHEEYKPEELVEMLSKLKGEEVYSRIDTKDDFILISADTIVCLGDKILGKPKNEEESFGMLKSLQGNKHTVYTGMFVVIKQEKNEERILTHSETKVYFKKLSDEEILEYIKQENTLDKAGAYAIQGNAKQFVDKIEGNINTVIGLDVEKLRVIIEKFEKKW